MHPNHPFPKPRAVLLWLCLIACLLPAIPGYSQCDVPIIDISPTSPTDVCEGMDISFEAVITDGTTYEIEWFVDGVPQGVNSLTFTATGLSEGTHDIDATVLSTEPCYVDGPVSSNVVGTTVTVYVTPVVSVDPVVTTICAGEEVTFNSNVSDAGASPSYDWQVNGVSTGETGTSFITSTLVDGDDVTVVITPDLLCSSLPTATSNNQTFTVNPQIAPSVSIAALAAVCPGMAVDFEASATDAASYKWWVDGVEQSETGSIFNYAAPTENSVVYAEIAPTNNCYDPLSYILTSNEVSVPTTPASPASNLSFISSGPYSLKMKFQRGEGKTGAIVIVKKDTPICGVPDCGVSYNASESNSTSWSSITDYIGCSAVAHKVVGEGVPGTEVIFNLHGLDYMSRYYYAIYEYDSSERGIVYSSAIFADTVTMIPPPTMGASNIQFDRVTATSASISWDNGDGTGRIVVIAPSGIGTAAPVTNTFYNGDTDWSLGSDLGFMNYVVYAGDANWVDVTGLSPNTQYNVMVYEYNDFYPFIKYKAATKKALKTAPDYLSMVKPGNPMYEIFDLDMDPYSTSSVLPRGWTMLETGPGADKFYDISDGSVTSDGIYNAGYFDASLGSVTSSGSGAIYGLKIRNTTTSVITSLLVDYIGEQWYSSGNADQITVSFSTDATSLTTGTYTPVPALTFNSPQTDSVGIVDGDSYEYSSNVVGSITGFSLNPGEDIWIRFTDETVTGANDLLSIDDIMMVPFSNTYTASDVLPAGTYNNLNIAGGTLEALGNIVVKTLNIDEGAVLDVSGHGTTRSITMNGEVMGLGTISTNMYTNVTFSSAYWPRLVNFTPGANTMRNLTVAGGCIVYLFTPVNIAGGAQEGIVRVGNADLGALLVADSLRLLSDTLGSATVAPIYGALIGDVTIERAMQAREGYRLLAHPFASSITMEDINDDLPLDLSGGAGQNAWYYDHSTAAPANITEVGTNSVWTPFSELEDEFIPGEAIRLNKPAGPLTIDMTGFLSQGFFVADITANPNDSFIVIGNPYPAGIKIGALLTDPVDGPIAAGTMYDAAIWTWNPQKGTGGAFVAIPTGKIPSASLHMCGSMVAMVPPGSTVSLAFDEHYKTNSGASKAFFRESEQVLEQGLMLSIEQNGLAFDETYVYFDKEGEVRRDAPKFTNPGLNLYSVSEEATRLSVDRRPFIAGGTVALGLEGAEKGKYTIKIGDYNLPLGMSLSLVDRFTGNETQVNANTTYDFTVDDRQGSQGNGRFLLKMAGSAGEDKLTMELTPNPATEQVTLRLNGNEDGKAQVRIISVTGQQMMSAEMASARHAQLTIPVASLAAGVYMVEISVNGQKLTKQLVKQ